MPAAQRAIAVLMIAIATLAAACQRSTFPIAPVRLAVGGQAQIVYLAVPLATRLGHFAAEGVEVEVHDFPGGAKSLEALWGGSVDVVCGFYDHTIQMAAEGRALKSFVTMLRYPGFVAVVAPHAAERIRSVKDLAGATVGVTSPGSSSHLFLNYLLARHGVSPDAVSTTGIGSTATAIAAVTRNRVDAAIMFDPAVLPNAQTRARSAYPRRYPHRSRRPRMVRSRGVPRLRALLHGSVD
ncbi:MAG: ABC transporter substrate-binding protein [Bryobacteraceae bacterium]